MTQYFLNIIRAQTANRGLSKPKNDINQILAKKDYKKIQVSLLIGKQQKLFKSLSSVKNILARLSSGDKIFIQYPTYMGALFDIALLNGLKRKKIFTSTLIHDVDALRFNQPWGKGLKYEIHLLNKTNMVISPNSVMTKFLKKNGLKTKTTDLKIFDYLTKVNVTKKSINYSHNVFFTGNLNKSAFIFKLQDTVNVKYKLFGPLDNHAEQLKKMYQGSLPSDELLAQVDNGFGLIWDGPDKTISNTSSASFGNYLQYNNPYKLSFYLASGIPVIIWDKAAESSFVTDNHLGFTISSIDEIDESLNSMTAERYQEMTNNVRNIQKKLVNGSFTTNVLNTI